MTVEPDEEANDRDADSMVAVFHLVNSLLPDEQNIVSVRPGTLVREALAQWPCLKVFCDIVTVLWLMMVLKGLSPDGWLPDRISIGVLTRAFPPDLVDEVVEATGTRGRGDTIEALLV